MYISFTVVTHAIHNLQPFSTVERAIVYGNIATHLGKNAIEGAETHKWTVYLRGLHGEDLSPYVSKVVFKLHDSFKDPTRGMDTYDTVQYLITMSIITPPPLTSCLY